MQNVIFVSVRRVATLRILIPAQICQDTIKKSITDLCRPRPERCNCNGEDEGLSRVISRIARGYLTDGWRWP